MANTIKIKNSGTTTAVPTSLEYGELGLNYADGKLYYKNLSNNIVQLAGINSTSLDGLTDVVITNPLEFQTLEYNGTNWVNANASSSVYVRNVETTTLTTGTVVYLFGATGDHADVKRADNTLDTTSSKTVGVVSADILPNENGVVVTQGYVDGIDLDPGYSSGQVLWLGKNGAFTTTKTVSPDHLVFVGVVVRATNNGIIYVSTQNGYELDEIHNVQISNTLASGDFLKYNGTLWVNDPINLGTDTVGNYMSDISGSNGITTSHTPAEGSSATIGVDNAQLVNFLLEGASGNSYGLIGTSAYLDVKNTNGYNKEIELDITAVETKLSADGYLTGTAHDSYDHSTAMSTTVLDDIGNVTAPSPSSGDFLKWNGTAWVNDVIDLGTDTTGSYVSSLVAGTGISLANNSGEGATPTITNSGVTSIAGTSNQITASGSTGSVTLSLPNDVTIAGTVTANTNLVSNFSSGDEGGEIKLAKPQSNTTLAGQVSIDIYQNKLRFFENGGSTRGFYLDITSGANGVGSNLSAGGGATTLDGLNDVTAPTPSPGDYLAFNGSVWVNSGIVMADISDGQAISSSSSPIFAGLTINGNASVTGSLVDHVSMASKTSSYTLVLADDGKMIEMNVGTANNLTVPADNTVNFPVGTSIDILQVGAGQTTLVATSGVTINRSTGLKLRTQWSAATLIKRAANTWVAIGDLSA